MKTLICLERVLSSQETWIQDNFLSLVKSNQPISVKIEKDKVKNVIVYFCIIAKRHFNQVISDGWQNGLTVPYAPFKIGINFRS